MEIAELYSKSHDVNSLYLPLSHIREVHPEEKVIIIVLNRHWITKLVKNRKGRSVISVNNAWNTYIYNKRPPVKHLHPTLIPQHDITSSEDQHQHAPEPAWTPQVRPQLVDPCHPSRIRQHPSTTVRSPSSSHKASLKLQVQPWFNPTWYCRHRQKKQEPPEYVKGYKGSREHLKI